MSSNNFAACLAVTLAYEGGFSAVRSDPGNWTGGKVGLGTLAGTKYGISAAAHPRLDIRALTTDSVAPIYEAQYWLPAGCDALAAGLDLSHFDATVNSGAGRSAKWLAKARAGRTVTDQIRAYASARLSFLEALRTWATFGKGWSTRVAAVEAKALAMSLATSLGPATAGTRSVVGRAVLGKVAARHGKAAAVAASVSTAAKVAAGGAAVAAVATPHPAAAVSLGASSVAVALVSGFLAWRNGLRAAALTHAVAG